MAASLRLRRAGRLLGTFLKREWPALLGMTIVVVLSWMVAHGRMNPATWDLPLEYSGDSQLYHAIAKATSESDAPVFGRAYVERLGAPFTANWNDFPLQDKPLVRLHGFLANLFGLFLAGNLMSILAPLTAAFSFYTCARFLRTSSIWSFVGGSLFGLSYYGFWRSGVHPTLAFTYTIPLSLLSTWLVAASRGMRPDDRRGVVCWITALLVGSANPYYLNLHLQLLFWAVLANFLTSRRRENLLVGLGSLGVALVTFFVVNLGVLLHRLNEGPNTGAIERHYFQVEQYGLKLMEFFVPPTGHHLPWLADIGRHYASLDKIQGEMFSPYLGIVGAVGLIWLGFAFFRTVIQRTDKSPDARALQVGWILAFSVTGGLNTLLALGGFQLFRATNRFSIFVFGIALFFLAGKLSRLTNHWSKQKSLALAGGILLLGWIDQVPSAPSREQLDSLTTTFLADRAYVAKLEERLPDGAMIFQLPVAKFPEAHPSHQMQDYDHFRLYVHSEDLRFSYGSNKGRPRENWQTALTWTSPRRMIERLESYGFGGVYLDRKGYPDGGDALLAGFVQLGLTNAIMDETKQRVCLLLNPSQSPTQPGVDEFPEVEFGEGWSYWDCTATEGVFWFRQQASFKAWTQNTSPEAFDLKATLKSEAPRQVALFTLAEGADQPLQLWAGNVNPDQPVPLQFRLMLSDAPLTLILQAAEGPGQVGLVNLDLRKSP